VSHTKIANSSPSMTVSLILCRRREEAFERVTAADWAMGGRGVSYDGAGGKIVSLSRSLKLDFGTRVLETN